MNAKLAALLSRKNLTIGLITFVLLYTAGIALFFHSISVQAKHAEISARDEMNSLCGTVHDTMVSAKVLADSLVRVMKNGEASNFSQLKERIFEIRKGYPHIYGVGFAFDPVWSRRNAAFFKDVKPNPHGLYSVFTTRSSNGAVIETPMNYDYTDPSKPGNSWYTLPKQSRRERWVGPYFGTAAQTHLAGIYIPMYDEQGQIMAVAFAEFTLTDLSAVLAGSSGRGGSGYFSLVNDSGKIVCHPRIELMDSKVSIKELGEKTNSSTLLAFSDSILKTSSAGSFTYQSIFTKEQTILKYQRIPDLGWYMFSVIPDGISQPFSVYQKHIFLFTAGLILIISLLWIVMHYHRHTWIMAVGVSLFLSLGTLALCLVSVKKYESGITTPLSVFMKERSLKQKALTCERVPLANAFAANAYLQRCLCADKKLLSIPTGIVVQTANFTDAYSFTMSGYIWQKYRSRADTSKLGIEFPENESVELTLEYDDSIAPGEFVRGWHFNTLIRQPFSYKNYPLDKEEMWLRMRPAGLAQDVILEPDFQSYRSGSGAILGIDENLVVSQWQILSTNFSYALNKTASNYGKKDFYSTVTNPELYFSIHVRRNILDAFISQLILIIVVLLMLFSILWLGRTSDNGLLGFNALSGVSGCSALFFVLIFNHITLRNSLGSPGVVYLEYYFFAAYIAMILVSCNSILVAMNRGGKLISYKDNQAARVLYWPFLTGGIFAATFFTFF